MTVHELIEALKKCPDTYEVFMQDSVIIDAVVLHQETCAGGDMEFVTDDDSYVVLK